MEPDGQLLIVEPNDAIRRMIALAGKPYASAVLEARTLKQGAILLGRKPAVVVSEVRLPDGSGSTLLQMVLKGSPESVFVALTAEDDVAGAVTLVRNGAFSVQPKPFGLDEVGVMLGRAYGQHEVVRRGREANELKLRYHNELEKRVGEQTSLISSLLEFSNRLNAAQTLEEAVELLLETLNSMVSCKRISILLETPETGQVAVAEALGLPPGIERKPINLEDSPVVRRVMEAGEVLYVEDVEEAGLASGRGKGKAFLSVPLLDSTAAKKAVFGVVNLTDREGNGEFTDTERRLVQSIADTASIACANLRNRGSLEKSYFDTVGALALALEAKDHYTHGHSQRVTSMCMVVADVMGFGNEKLDQIMFAGMLHDVGKIGIAEAILLKPKRLTNEEFLAIREHPVVGQRMVSHISFLSSAASIIRHHHERWDGKGYPDGLRGEEIELPARIMAIADSYDAMTTDRSYRRKLQPYQVMDELMKGRGTQFDPECLDLFVRHVAESPSIPVTTN
jgi:HD-GYP domain-containing protein (c-di-GMP phosphodiesterase class II)